MSKERIRKSRNSLFNEMGRAACSVSSQEEADVILKWKYKEWHHSDRMLAWSADAKDGRISYARSVGDQYDSDRRVKMSLARYMRRVGKIPLEAVGHNTLNKYCCSVVKNLLAAQTGNYTLLSGQDIVDAFADAIGGDSCMTGRDSKYTEMYAANDNVELLVYDNGTMKARALVWTLANGTKVLDRIYPNDGFHVSAIQEYATSRNWVVRLGTSLPCGDVLLSDDSFREIKVSQDDDNYWPFLDTFRYVCDSQRERGVITLTLTNEEREEEAWVLDSTGGSLCDNSHTCYACDQIFVGEYRLIEGDEIACMDCINSDYTQCMDDMVYRRNDEVIYIEDASMNVSELYANENCSYCDHCGYWFSEEENMTSVTEYHMCCQHCYDGKYVICKCGKHFMQEDDVHDGLCDSCYTETEQKEKVTI